MGEAPATFFASALRFLVLMACVYGAIIELGGSPQTFLAVGGAVLVALGLGLKDTLTNVAAGIMVLVNQMFQVGDYIAITTFQGTVKRINLFQTEINNSDNLRVYIPNQLLWSNALTNYSHNRVRFVDIKLPMLRRFPVAECLAAIKAAIAEEQKILTEPTPLVGVDTTTDALATYYIRASVRTPDYMAVRYGLIERIERQMLARGLDVARVFPIPPLAAPAAPEPAAPDSAKAKKPATKAKK
jgi:small conductance mechanosensitive channel